MADDDATKLDEVIVKGERPKFGDIELSTNIGTDVIAIEACTHLLREEWVNASGCGGASIGSGIKARIDAELGPSIPIPRFLNGASLGSSFNLIASAEGASGGVLNDRGQDLRIGIRTDGGFEISSNSDGNIQFAFRAPL